MINQPTWEWGF